MNAIDVVNVTKTYRKYARRKQFATLKSAILSGTLVNDLNPDETFNALKGVSFNVPRAAPSASSAATDPGRAPR